METQDHIKTHVSDGYNRRMGDSSYCASDTGRDRRDSDTGLNHGVLRAAHSAIAEGGSSPRIPYPETVMRTVWRRIRKPSPRTICNMLFPLSQVRIDPGCEAIVHGYKIVNHGPEVVYLEKDSAILRTDRRNSTIEFECLD